MGAVLQKGSDLGFLLGYGRASKSLTSDLPRFLRKMKKAGPGVETSAGSCSGGASCMARLRSGEESPDYCAMNTVNSL